MFHKASLTRIIKQKIDVKTNGRMLKIIVQLNEIVRLTRLFQIFMIYVIYNILEQD